ncbi:MAG: hypothetical protein ACOCYZ_06305 [Halococcoides sp.]
MNTTGGGGVESTPRRSRHRTIAIAVAVLAVTIGVLAVGTVVATDVAVVSVDATPERPTVYDDVTVETTVTNPVSSDREYVIDWIEIREGEDSDSDRLNRTDASRTVRAGQTETVESEIDIEESGSRTVYAHMRLLTRGSGSISVVRPVQIDVIDPHPDLSLRAGPIDAANRTDLSLSVVNGRQAAIQGLSLETEGDGVRIKEPRRVAGDLSAGETRNFEFTGVEATSGPATVDVAMNYVTADGTHRQTTTTLRTDLEPRQNPARIELTNTRISREDGGLVIRGEASNAGGSNASGVEVSVGSSETVDPASDQSTFFPGEIRADEYKTFTVHASVENASRPATVPIEVEYTVDGVEHSQTFEKRFDPGGAAPDDRSDGSGSSSLAIVAVIGGLVVVIAGLFGVYRYRTRDDDDA